MAVIKVIRALAAIAAISGAAASYAQQPVVTTVKATQPTPEPKLAFDREVYAYGASARRDPFKPLVGKESLGPLFEDLKLKGIIFSPEPTMSIALVQDGSKRQYRLHRGEVVGNSRIVEIKPLLVRFAVENFGMIKYEVLELRVGGYAAVPAERTKEAQAEKPKEQAAAPELPPRVDFPKDNPARSKQLIDSIAKERREKTAALQKSDARQPETETPR